MVNKSPKSVHVRFYSFDENNEWACSREIPDPYPGPLWTYHTSANALLERVDELINENP